MQNGGVVPLIVSAYLRQGEPCVRASEVEAHLTRKAYPIRPTMPPQVIERYLIVAADCLLDGWHLELAGHSRKVVDNFYSHMAVNRIGGL